MEAKERSPNKEIVHGVDVHLPDDRDNKEDKKEEEERKKKELAECVASQSDAETEAMLDEALEDVEFPCKNHKETVMIKNMTKDLVKEAWCIEQSDNPGPLQPDGTHLKPKMTATDIQNAVNKVLESEDYIVEEELKEKCPTLYCLYNKMIQMNNNFVCKYVTPTFDSKKFTELYVSTPKGRYTLPIDHRNKFNQNEFEVIKVEEYEDKTFVLLKLNLTHCSALNCRGRGCGGTNLYLRLYEIQDRSYKIHESFLEGYGYDGHPRDLMEEKIGVDFYKAKIRQYNGENTETYYTVHVNFAEMNKGIREIKL